MQQLASPRSPAPLAPPFTPRQPIIQVAPTMDAQAPYKLPRQHPASPSSSVLGARPQLRFLRLFDSSTITPCTLQSNCVAVPPPDSEGRCARRSISSARRRCSSLEGEDGGEVSAGEAGGQEARSGRGAAETGQAVEEDFARVQALAASGRVRRGSPAGAEGCIFWDWR